MKTETITLTHKEAAEGKVLTDGIVYVHEVYLAPSEDPAKWTEIDATDVPGSDVTGYDIWTDAEKQAWESRWLSEYLTPVQED